MFALTGVRADAVPLENLSISALLEDPRRGFGGIKHQVSGRQGPSLRVTRAPHVLASVTSALTDWRGRLGDDAALVLANALIRPARVFEGNRSHDGVQRFLVVGSFRIGADVKVGVLRVQVSAERSRDGQPLVFGGAAVIDGDDDVELSAAMAAVYRETRDARTLVIDDRPRLLLLGGDNSSADAVGACAAAFGFSTEIFGRPESNFNQAKLAIGDRRDLIALWAGALPHRPDIVERLRTEALKRGLPILDLRAPSLDGMIDDLTLELMAYEHEIPTPKTMAEALEMAKQTCPNLTFLPEADASAAASPFWRPSEVLQGVQFANEVARRWQNDELASGITEEFISLPVRYASDISTTTKNEYGGHYTVKYERREVMMGPHLKFGKKSPERCARVYWFVDKEHRKFVIGHFGRHLPDDTG